MDIIMIGFGSVDQEIKFFNKTAEEVYLAICDKLNNDNEISYPEKIRISKIPSFRFNLKGEKIPLLLISENEPNTSRVSVILQQIRREKEITIDIDYI